jgi:hypothetical protein
MLSERTGKCVEILQKNKSVIIDTYCEKSMETKKMCPKKG